MEVFHLAELKKTPTPKFMKFAACILHWYDQNKRDLPWRQNPVPYHIWLSEILMQQTRIEQGTPYYLRFVEAFPTVHDLAAAPEEKVMKLWQGLGYYNRARNLHATAKYISRECGGVFPDSYKDLLSLKGVGSYTASAIASICFGEARAVVDGNVYRVLSRYYGIDSPIDRPPGQREFQALADSLLPKSRRGDYNQGIMEFGAMQCRPKNPGCSTCPLQEGCQAHRQGRIVQLPVKTGKTKVKKEYLHFALVLDPQGEFRVQQRPVKGYWPRLYEFPGLKLDREESSERIQESLRKELNLEPAMELRQLHEQPIKHQLSHRALQLYFWSTEQVHEMGVEQKQKALSKIEGFAWPVPLAEFLQRMKF